MDQTFKPNMEEKNRDAVPRGSSLMTFSDFVGGESVWISANSSPVRAGDLFKKRSVRHRFHQRRSVQVHGRPSDLKSCTGDILPTKGHFGIQNGTRIEEGEISPTDAADPILAPASNAAGPEPCSKNSALSEGLFGAGQNAKGRTEGSTCGPQGSSECAVAMGLDRASYCLQEVVETSSEGVASPSTLSQTLFPIQSTTSESGSERLETGAEVSPATPPPNGALSHVEVDDLQSSSRAEATPTQDDPDTRVVARPVSKNGLRRNSTRGCARRVYSEAEFFALQAILTIIPHQGAKIANADRSSLNDRIQNDKRRCAWRVKERIHWRRCMERVLLKNCQLYPRYALMLGCLKVVFGSRDMVIFVDDTGRQMFTAVRGTNPMNIRDLADDALVALGYTPSRMSDVQQTYIKFRGENPSYRSYACGHSLGGAILHELACGLEACPESAFDRVDVFNAVGSPLRKGENIVNRMRFYSHRVESDLLSMFYVPPGGNEKADSSEVLPSRCQVVVHDASPHCGPHRMGNFLPPRRPSSGLPGDSFASTPECCLM